MRLIDADALMKQIRLLANRTSLGEITLPSIGGLEIVGLIMKAPTIDAVPVVRCKDCKHRGGYNCPMYHTETSLDDLDGFDDYNVDKTDSDGFCHRGEKKG